MSQTHAEQLLPRLSRYLDYFQALTEVGKILTANVELPEVLEATMRWVARLMKPRHWQE